MNILVYKPGLDDGSQNELPNIGMGILAAAIKQYDPSVTLHVIDRHFNPNAKAAIDITTMDMVCLSLVSQEWLLDKTQLMIQFFNTLGIPIVVGGPHAFSYWDILEKDPRITKVVVGEVDGQWDKVVESKEKVVKLPHPTLLMTPDFSDFYGIKNMTAYPLYTSRGCTNRCLSGDTIIHTLWGDVPIKDLVGKQGVKVLTRDPVTYAPIYADAINISMTQKDAKLVRVHFDDGSHIDCTPDHKFMVFRYRNQFDNEDVDFEVEAQNLKPKMQVRAVSFATYKKTGRVTLFTKRKVHKNRAHAVMECLIGRHLMDNEVVHHNDRDPSNDLPTNLALKCNNSEHMLVHKEEQSKRMRENNPIHRMPREWLVAKGESNRGKKRSLESRIKYRESKLGPKNPQWKEDCVHVKHRSRIDDAINHKVVAVEFLAYTEDVYCMEVPDIHWFYANKVLVHNCNFCVGSAFHGRFRTRNLDDSLREIKDMAINYPNVNKIYVVDDCFTGDLLHAQFFLTKFNMDHWNTKYELQIINVRADQVTDDILYQMKAAGCSMLPIGVESADQFVFSHVGKGESLADIKSAIRMIQNAGITPWLNMIVGLPHDNPDAHRKSVDWCLQITKPRIVHWFLMSPFRRTRAYKYFIDKGSIQDGYIPQPYGRTYNELPWESDFETSDFSKEQRMLAQLEAYLKCHSPILVNNIKHVKRLCLQHGLITEYNEWEQSSNIKIYVEKELPKKKSKGQVK